MNFSNAASGISIPPPAGVSSIARAGSSNREPRIGKVQDLARTARAARRVACADRTCVDPHQTADVARTAHAGRLKYTILRTGSKVGVPQIGAPP
jgi:hypothetical protein